MPQSDFKITFYTATILEWKPLLVKDVYKQIIVDSLRHLVSTGKMVCSDAKSYSTGMADIGSSYRIDPAVIYEIHSTNDAQELKGGAGCISTILCGRRG